MKAKEVHLISICEKVSNENSYFHFLGFFNGFKIKKIIVHSKLFKPKEEYYLVINAVEVHNEIMYGKLKTYKKIFI